MFGPSRLCAITCLWTWLTLSAAPAHALELRWSAPESCPSQSAVQARLDGLLGEKAADVRATIAVQPQRSGYELTLRLEGERVRGTRELHGTDCAALTEAAVWLVANAVDPALSAAAPAPEPAAPEPAPEVKPPPPPAPAVPKALPRPVPTSPWALHAAVFGGLLKTMERPLGQGAVGLALGGSWNWLAAELRADIGIPNESPLASGTVKVANQAFSLASCGLWGGRFRAGPCLQVGAVRTHADARDLPVDRPAVSKVWMQAQLGLQVAAWVARSLELFVEGGVGTSLSTRPRFTVARSTSALPAEQVTAYGRLGLRFRWPLSPATDR